MDCEYPLDICSFALVFGSVVFAGHRSFFCFGGCIRGMPEEDGNGLGGDAVGEDFEVS